MPERVIPGVQVTVVKDVVVPQLSPAGVLGIVGLVEDGAPRVGRAASWRRFIKDFGLGSASSLPEAKAALENGVTELVVVAVDPETAAAARLRVPMSDDQGDAQGALGLIARARGCWANGTRVVIKHKRRGETIIAFDAEILLHGQKPGDGESFQSQQLLPGSSRSFADALAARSSILRYDAETSPELSLAGFSMFNLTDDDDQPLLTLGGDEIVRVKANQPVTVSSDVPTDKGKTHRIVVTRTADGALLLDQSFNLQDGPLYHPDSKMQGCPDAGALFQALDALDEVDVVQVLWPSEGEHELSEEGRDAPAKAYIDALAALVDEPDVDLVCAAVQYQRPQSKEDRATRDANALKARLVYSQIISHCELMAAESKGRLGFGHVPPGLDTSAATDMADSLVSDRFALISPTGLAGAVAGRVGSLPYFQSPTMKTLAGVADLPTAHGQEDQKALLTGRLVPVAKERGRGVIVVKGITTDGEQLSVRRVADRASRGVKLIGDLFIGRLNNSDGRAALRQKLGEFLYQMQKDGAIVPSTDGESPAFQLDVYSSQDDFSKGIVRVDLAVRPVRAIDFIYATLLVQV